MAYRLKNRQLQIPGGFRFVQSETGWTSTKFASFSSIVSALVQHRRANPRIGQQVHWSTDEDEVASEVDAYNTKLCLDHGWMNYVVGSEGDPAPPLPLRPRSLSEKLGSVAAGAKVLVHWLGSGAESISKEASERRALICSTCPRNTAGDMSSFFTVPVSNAIRSALNQRREWKLSTSLDDKLGVCDACLCPIKLKLHIPMDQIRPSISKEVKEELDPRCWMLSEW